MDLSPESRKAEESLEEQKDEFQREPKAEFLSAGISAEPVFHHGVQLGSVCVSGDAALKPLPVALVRGAALNTGTRTLVSELDPESAPGSPLGARSRPPPPRPAVTPALGATGREWRRDGRPRAGAGAERLRWGGRSAQSRPARRRRRRGARREPQSGRRHFSLRQRRGLGRGDSGNGERLRLRFRLRRRRRGQAGPGAHYGAGEGADRRGKRTGALAADDGQVFSEVYREARRRPGQLRAEVHRHVHGPVHGLLEHSFASLQFSAAAGESQHVTPAGLRAEKGPCGEGTAASPGGYG